MARSRPRQSARTEPEPESDPTPDGAARSLNWLGLLGLLLAVGIGSWLRIDTALSDPNFTADTARPLLRTDPALLYYFTDRIIEAGGLAPDDFRADPRVEHPETSDLPAMFTICQEFVIAWVALLAGDGIPLHVLCIWVMGIFAALTVVGVFGLATELTRDVRWGLAAAAIYLVILGNYRTIGFILIREDFSIPWFSLHLWLLARSVRVRTATCIGLAGLTLVLAAASWHAMGFMIAIEGGCLFAWFLRSGQNPLAARRAWVGVLVLVAGSLLVPVLRSKLFVLSLPMVIGYTLLLTGFLSRRPGWEGARIRIAGLVLLPVLLGVTAGLSHLLGGGLGDYSHVFELVFAKLRHMGELPADLNELSFDARLLWQSPPFQTADYEYYLGALRVGLIPLGIALLLAVRGFWTGRGDGRWLTLFTLCVVSAAVAWLIRRTIILPAMTVPVVAVVLLSSLRSKGLAVGLLAGGLMLQMYYFVPWIEQHRVAYYHPMGNLELRKMIDWVEQNVPEGEPVASDFVTSTAILAHTRHPIVQQPKYETTRSRRRIEEFLMTFFYKPPAELRALLKKYDCRYLVVDRSYWGNNAVTAGFRVTRNTQPPRGSSMATFCSNNPRALTSAPGFELLYRSPEAYKSDLFRIYRVN